MKNKFDLDCRVSVRERITSSVRFASFRSGANHAIGNDLANPKIGLNLVPNPL
jgi:hypothetical protein